MTRESDVRFSFDWELIDAAREFLLRYLSRLCNREVAGEVCLAAHELMENAVKYSSDPHAVLSLFVEDDGRLQLVVENRPLPDHLLILAAELAALKHTPDAFAHYRQKMTEAAERNDGKSGLGLARIRCESRMDLSYELAGGMLRVMAVKPGSPQV